MKKACWILSIVCLLLWAVPGMAQDTTARDAALREAVQRVDGRPIQLAAYEYVDETDARCGFFVTSADRLGDTTDFAFWFMREGGGPQLIFDGAAQPLPEDEWDDDRTYPREALQAFRHKGHTYFLASSRTGQRQSDGSDLYMLMEGNLVHLKGFYAGAGYHPQAGLYGLDYDYATDPGFEAGRMLTPVFYALDGDQVTPTVGVEVLYDQLLQLHNGEDIQRTLGATRATPDSMYYLPNHMIVVNYTEYLSEYEMNELTTAYVGINNGEGTLVRYPNQLEAPDVTHPFWQACQTVDDARVEGRYTPNEYFDNPIRPAAFLALRADVMTTYGLEAAADIRAQLGEAFAHPHRGAATAEQLDAIARIAGNADPQARELFARTLTFYNIGALDEKASGVYDPVAVDRNGNGIIEAEDTPANSISLYLAEDADNPRGAYATYFHEVGHAIDANVQALQAQPGMFSQQFVADTGLLTQVTLEQAIHYDVSHHLKGIIEMHTSDADQVGRIFNWIWPPHWDAGLRDEDAPVTRNVLRYYNRLFQDAGYTISDIYGGTTDNRIFLDATPEEEAMGYSAVHYGHFGEEYWYVIKKTPVQVSFSRTHTLPAELFAGYFSARMRDNVEEISYYRYFLPQSVQVLDQMVMHMLAALDKHLP